MRKDRQNLGISYKLPERVLIAPDKFKGTLSSEAAGSAIEKGIRRAWPKAKTTCLALSDGGEGFVELMVRQTGGKLHAVSTIDAALRPCHAEWGVLGDKRTAVIGLTNASGIVHLPVNLRDPEETNNLGTGRLIGLALREGFKEIVMGLGGSATTEGGISLAAAIGYRFLDRAGHDIFLNGNGLTQLAKIVPPATMPKARFVVATDVDNPLYGPKGAAFQFAGQKGADAAAIVRLDLGLRRLARIVKRDLGKDMAKVLGAGAAGGCGYGLMVFFDAKRENGFQLVRRVAKLDSLIRGHDLVITGEGCLDPTSLGGKGPVQLGELARKLKRPVWALCGKATLPRGKSPFDKLAALSTSRKPGPSLNSLTSAQHAQRLEELAYEMAKSCQSPGSL